MMLGTICIPGHITALYVFAVVNLMALFHVTLVEANIIVMDEFNITLEELPDLPAQFGPNFPAEGLWGHIVHASPNQACSPIAAPPYPEQKDIKWIAVIMRKGCNFDEKVYHAQQAGYAAALVHNVNSSELVPMGSGQKGDLVNIPSAFIGEADAMYLVKNFNKKLKFFVVIDNRVPFNANLYLVPFAIVVGICFVLMLAFMIAKWVRDIRKKRRARLSKENLKKLPVKKFKKGDPYDVCAICLDEYENGEKLRILPCQHAYHMKCVDPWLTKNKRTCPVCKRKVIPGDTDSSDSDTDTEDEADNPSETTPLLTTQNAGTFARTRPNFGSGSPGSSPTGDVPEDSDSDTDESVEVAAAASTSQSLVDVHHTPTGSINRGGYGATGSADVTVRNERAQSSASRNSEVIAEAVGGVEIEDDTNSVDFIDDHYSMEKEMRGLVGGDTSDDEGKKSGFFVKVFGRKKNRKRKRDEEA